MKQGGQLIEYNFPAISAFHTEVRALLLAVQAIKEANLNRAVLITDCKQLAEAIKSKEPPTNIDWRFYSELIQIWLFVKDNYGVNCVFKGIGNTIVRLTN
jgi:ribonuclease HI